MSATEDDTELRDLLIQNLENNGVLNKLKAEMRAAVFLAMEEQDQLENKSPLINENLKKCLNSRDGRLVAGLIVDFLQVFNLDFSLAVFQPEINSLNSLDSRDLVCRDLCLSESEVNRNCPLLLELVRRGRHKPSEEPSQKQISVARKKFDFYDKDGSGSVRREDLNNVFTDLFPSLNKYMLERFITDELRAADQSFSTTVDFQVFVGFYKRLFSQCRAVVVQDSEGVLPEEKISSVSKDLDSVVSLSQGELQHSGSRLGEASHNRTPSVGLEREHLDLDLEVEEDHEDGDSFFDDPLPKPQKTYGCLSVLPAEDRLSELRKVESSGTRGSPAGSLSEAPRPGPGPGGGSSTSEQSHSRNEDDVEYDDDFNSHRSDLSKSELSIGEEIEEVSIEGPDVSDKFDESTQDLSVSQLSQSHGADYMEEVV
ncbi:centrosomal protein 43 isoform X3 [Anarhichas minor]|uniref:centrosomal protein 43 isoform X3 n=1 Tax=Anarhichas minor TaxID=65739 RepID=UPI003F737F59